jgi:DNA-binding response OmpR family regulator
MAGLSMCQLLMIGVDRSLTSAAGSILAAAGYRFAATCCGRDAIAMSQALQPHVVLIDVALPDMSGLEVLRAIRRGTPSASCLMISNSEYTSWALVVEAMRGGASDWLQKPLSQEMLLDAVARACDGQLVHDKPALDLPTSHPCALLRLARTAVAFASAPNDAPTLREYSRAVGISTGGFRNWCRTAQVQAHGYHQLARALRAVYRLEHGPRESIENILEIVDRRTLAKFVAAANGGTGDGMPPTVDELLTVQRFVSSTAAAVPGRVNDFETT